MIRPPFSLVTGVTYNTKMHMVPRWGSGSESAPGCMGWESGPQSQSVRQQARGEQAPAHLIPSSFSQAGLVLMLWGPVPGFVPLDLGLGIDVSVLATSLRVASKELAGVRATCPPAQSVQVLRPEFTRGQAVEEYRLWSCHPCPDAESTPLPQPTPLRLRRSQTPIDTSSACSYPTMHMVLSVSQELSSHCTGQEGKCKDFKI